MARKDANPGARERAAENRVQALEFRKAGFTYQEIGQKLGVSHGMAHRYVQQSLAELATQEFTNAAELRQLELERLDIVVKGAIPFVRSGSPNHANSMIGAIKERAKLTGIYKQPEGLTINIELVIQLEHAIAENGLNAADVFEAMLKELHANSRILSEVNATTDNDTDSSVSG